MPLLLRNTALSQYAQCPKKFYWSSIRHLQPKNRPVYFADGSLTHEGLKAYYHPSTQDLPAEDRLDMALNQIRLTAEPEDLDTSMASRLLRAHSIKYPKHDFKVLAVEQKVSFPLTENITFRGTADMVMRMSNGSLALGEHKTAASLSSNLITHYGHSPQTLGYVYALQQTLKEPVSTILFNFLIKTKTAKCEQYPVSVVQKFEDQWLQWAQSLGERLYRDKKENVWQENRYECYPFIGKPCPYQPLCWYGESDQTLAFFQEMDLDEPNNNIG